MFGELTEQGYTMYNKELDKQVNERLKGTSDTDKSFIKLYMDTHYINSVEELENLVKTYGKIAFTHYRYGRSLIISTLRYTDMIGINGATEPTYKSDELDNFLEDAVQAFLKIESVKTNLGFIDLLKYKISKMKNF